MVSERCSLKARGEFLPNPGFGDFAGVGVHKTDPFILRYCFGHLRRQLKHNLKHDSAICKDYLTFREDGLWPTQASGYQIENVPAYAVVLAVDIANPNYQCALVGNRGVVTYR